MTKELFTICLRCAHLINLEPGSVRQHVWYNHVCRASLRPTFRDPYDGVVKPHGADSKFQYCRNVNPDGHCPYFLAGPCSSSGC